jgi:hypothetical protein
MDPSGKRTIFVLTKADQVESNLVDPDRVSYRMIDLNKVSQWLVFNDKWEIFQPCTFEDIK